MFKVFTRLARMVRNLRTVLSDGLSLFAATSRRRTAVAAENLFLRKQLALFREREKKAMPTTPRMAKILEPVLLQSVASDSQAHGRKLERDVTRRYKAGTSVLKVELTS